MIYNCSMIHKCRQALILAAGKGKRLEEYGEEKPKSLYEFNGKSLLQRKIEIFNNFGVEEILITVGYKAEMIEDAVKDYENVSLIYNPHYEDGQTMESISAALPYINYCCIQTEADLTFDPKVLNELMRNSSNSMVHCEIQETNCITVPHFVGGKFAGYRREEEYRTGIQEPPNFVGPSHFTKHMLESMTKYNIQNNYQLLYEEAAAIASSSDSIPLSILYYPNYKFWDLNKQDDFEPMEKIIKMLDGEVL